MKKKSHLQDDYPSFLIIFNNSLPRVLGCPLRDGLDSEVTSIIDGEPEVPRRVESVFCCRANLSTVSKNIQNVVTVCGHRLDM